MTSPSTDPRLQLPLPDQVRRPSTEPDVRNSVHPPLETAAPPRDAPNVVIVLLDDMGFGASSAFGGPCHMPAAERLAQGGLKYSRFHTTALCSPTRQSLLTGRNHHAVNMAAITGLATSVPGYTSVRPRSAATIAEVLKHNGYKTAAFGKMHQTPIWETSASGPFDRWPTGEGFERFYGFIGGEADQWSPLLYEGTSPVEPPSDPDYHLSTDLTDQAIAWVRSQRTLAPDSPFFLYLSFGATHAPHHAPASWIEKYRGRFDEGWDAERERILASQVALGVVPEGCELTRRHDEIPAWNDLSEDEKLVAARLMEAFAGFAEHTDNEVSRLLDALTELDSLDNTLFLYILGDNGASGEGGIPGTTNEVASLNGLHDSTENVLAHLDKIGGPESYNHYPVGWAHATNTPYQWTKSVASHWGGTRVGMIAHYPDRIPEGGQIRNQWHHVIDVVPTILELAGLPAPKTVNGFDQQPIDGVSFAYSFDDAAAEDQHTTQYFEIFGNRGVFHQGWSACTKHSNPWNGRSKLIPFADDVWVLYAPGDWSQAHDLAAAMPEKLRELQELFRAEAERNFVYPMDDRRSERRDTELVGRPDPLAGRTTMTLYPGMSRLAESAVPTVRNKAHQVSAALSLREDDEDGVILSQGGRFGGWVLYLRDGRLEYCHNWLDRERYVVAAPTALGAGSHVVSYRFVPDEGEGFGRGGIGELHCDGELLASARIERTVPHYFGTATSTDVGCDLGSPVVGGYRCARGAFTGDIEWVRIDVDGPPVEAPHQVTEDIELATQ
ncbi:arylsulfatase AtsD [Pseudonocardia ailaonensis]|uniref:Arylsulfatase AtsD n=1 Tax=Pseudonocardia ailaonensis TaxID=367279 RepID=A0ABN2MI80_9PSEU